jgi:hypothetical protein
VYRTWKAWKKPRQILVSLYTPEAFIVNLSEIFEEELALRTLPVFQDILAKSPWSKNNEL